MLVSWKWLKQFVDTDGIDPLAFAEKFTTTVAEIDDVVQWGFGLRDVIIADVLAVAPHPNADKLRLATVDIGGKTVQVVCGAPDLRVGLRVPFVPPGVTLPSGITVRDGEVRGIPSPGMLASEKDLGLSDEHAGLLSLDGCDAPAGTPLPEAIELEDVLYDVDNKAITHRPDLWGLYGVAREVAAMLDKPLKSYAPDVQISAREKPLDVEVQAGDACPRYVCMRIANLRVQPAPVQARLLLRRLGTRPISNVVDATNLVMLEIGNPLHAFDARFLRGGKIVVRRALAHESITTLDGQLRHLQTQDCVICDGEGPIALAGIMGGADSEIREDTTEIVLEAANFDAPTIRRTAMRLGMRSESSARFEKALDPALTDDATLRFAQLALAWSPGAQIASARLAVVPDALAAKPSPAIRTTRSYLRERLGVTEQEMPKAWLDACLRRLEFGIEDNGDEIRVTIPGFRATKDIKIAEDLVEELGRHYGYDNIRSEAPKVAARPPHTPPRKLLERQLRNILTQAGLTEQVLYGFDDEDSRRRLGLQEPEMARISVKNPISAQHTHMRRNLLPNLLRVAEQGLVQGDDGQPAKKGLNIGIFEIGRVFVPEKSDDRGLPPVLARGDEAQIAAYTAGMEGEMLRGVLDARAGTQPLPLQPIRLGVVFAERLGGGAEGAKLVFPAPEVTHRLLQQMIAALSHVMKWLGKQPLQLLPRGELHSLGAPDARPSWRSHLGYDLVTTGGETIGWLAALHPRVRIELDQPAQAVLAELDVDALLRVENVKRVTA